MVRFDPRDCLLTPGRAARGQGPDRSGPDLWSQALRMEPPQLPPCWEGSPSRRRPREQPLKSCNCSAINGGKKPVDNNRAAISCNNGLISLQDTFMLSGTNKGEIINLCAPALRAALAAVGRAEQLGFPCRTQPSGTRTARRPGKEEVRSAGAPWSHTEASLCLGHVASPHPCVPERGRPPARLGFPSAA